MNTIFFAVIVVIVIVCIYSRASFCEDYLYGFWTASDDDFCERSGISSIMLFIGEPVGWFKKERNCYLVIEDNICNQGLTLRYINPVFWGGQYTINASVVFDEENIWSENITIKINPADGTIKIYDNETIYVLATKQHATTNLARESTA